MFNMLLRDPKAMASLQAAILFIIVANPVTYRFVQTIFGCIFKVANSSGCPTIAGLILHALVFGLLSYGLMMLKRPAVVVVADKAAKLGEMVMTGAEDVVESIPQDIVDAEKAVSSEVMKREGFMSRRKYEGYGCGLQK
jgi:hypothetical protein